MDAMRAKGDDQDRVFVVRRLKISGTWAWLDCDPQSRDGSNHYEPESALLRNVYPLMLNETSHWIDDATVRLDSDLGLVYEPKETE